MKEVVLSASVQAIAAHHITKPGRMNIIVHDGELNFYPNSVNLVHELKPGRIYLFQVGPFGPVLLEGNDLSMPDKLYDFDDDKEFRAQILRTLHSETANNNVGVLLSGTKGMGKTVAAKMLMKEANLPIIMITKSINSGVDFAGYLANNVKQDYILMVDEFEKLFSDGAAHDRYGNPTEVTNEGKNHNQNSFLSFLDGTLGLHHKRLVLFTTNSEVNDKLLNRPSRIRYYKQYTFLKKEIFDAIVEDKLINKAFKKDLEDSIDPRKTTIDVLTTIIDEINLHNRPYSSFKAIFNYREEIVRYDIWIKNLKTDTWMYEREIKANRDIIDEKSLRAHVGGDAEFINLDESGDEVKYLKQATVFTDPNGKVTYNKYPLDGWDEDQEDEANKGKVKYEETYEIMLHRLKRQTWSQKSAAYGYNF